MWRSTASTIVLGIALFGCGGAEIEATSRPDTADEHGAEESISLVRRSFEAMGGIERLRLAGAEVSLEGTVNALGETFSVRHMLGGPERYRLDYVEEEVSFSYSDGVCRKTVYGIPARCTPEEAIWVTPVRIINGLVFPSGDAAKLRANFRMKDDVSVDGVACAVAEIRPKNSNFKIRAAFDQSTGLLARVDFSVKRADGANVPWSTTYSDWREVEKMKVPFHRQVLLEGRVVWEETLLEVDFDGYDERAFRAPVPPSTDQPHPSSLPDRRIARTEVFGTPVEIPAPPATIGGGAVSEGKADRLPSANVVWLVHRGPIDDAPGLHEILLAGVSAAGKRALDEPHLMLLERPPSEGEAATMALYVPVGPGEQTEAAPAP